MKLRKIGTYRISNPSIDGAGVHLRRVFSQKERFDLDPFLMLDTFDSNNPQDYLAGFPFHPHRGIETFTYLIDGEIIHRDSLGNQGSIRGGEYQWMNSGSGILHEEMPQASSCMFGFQLWVNLAQSEKMSVPTYFGGNAENIPVTQTDEYTVHILAGAFAGVTNQYQHGKFPILVLDVELAQGSHIEIPIDPAYHCFVFAMQGGITVCGSLVEEKAAATLIEGDTIVVEAKTNAARFFVFAGKPLDEPIAWGGSIVMNTAQELEIARQELRDGTFIKT